MLHTDATFGRAICSTLMMEKTLFTNSVSCSSDYYEREELARSARFLVSLSINDLGNNRLDVPSRSRQVVTDTDIPALRVSRHTGNVLCHVTSTTSASAVNSGHGAILLSPSLLIPSHSPGYNLKLVPI